jgi:hypothetical protein
MVLMQCRRDEGPYEDLMNLLACTIRTNSFRTFLPYYTHENEGASTSYYFHLLFIVIVYFYPSFPLHVA